jgi:hypothetical protein
MKENTLRIMKKYSCSLIILFVLILLCITVSATPDEVMILQSVTSEVESSTETNETTAVVYEIVSLDLAIEQMLNNSLQDIEEMKKAGLGTYYVSDIYIQMQTEAKKIRPKKETIAQYYSLLTTAKEDAFYIQDFIILKEQEITEFEQISGLNVTEALILLEKGRNELEYERYDNAKEALNKITSTLDDIQVNASRLSTQMYAQTNRVLEWVKNNSIQISIFLIIIVLVGFLSYKKLGTLRIERKIENLEREQDVLTGLLKKSQAEYYAEQKITKRTYSLKKEIYKKRIEEIKSILPVLKKELLKRK